MQDEIADLTKKFLATTATKAAYSLAEVIDNPTDLGNKERMIAAKDILDRGGFVKTDKVEGSAANPLFILPPKNED